MVEATKRLSNIEALRVIAFSMVVFNHVAGGGLLFFYTNSANGLFANLVTSWSKVAVDVFVLIAAYFLSAKDLNPKGIARRWVLLVWPILIMAAAYVIYAPPQTPNAIPDFLLHIAQGSIYSTYQGLSWTHVWYVFPFLFMVALSPLMNRAISSMDHSTFKYVLGILIAIILIPPTLHQFSTYSIVYEDDDHLLYFIALYFIAGYIRKYDIRMATKKALLVWFSTVILITVLTFIYSNTPGVPTEYQSNIYMRFYDINGLLVISGAVFLFMAFRQIEFKNRTVSLLGRFTYDAYLIHPLAIAIGYMFVPIWYRQILPFHDYSTQMLEIGIIAILLSLVYGMVRYFMDLGLEKLIKLSKLDKIGNWMARSTVRTSHRLRIMWSSKP